MLRLMRAPNRVSLLVLLLAFGTVSAAQEATSQGDEGRKIGDLNSKESLRIRFQSRGDYHSHDRFVTITGGVAKTAIVAEPSRDSVGVTHKAGGLVALSSAAVAGLDALLDYYRNPRKEDCLVVDTITLNWLENGKPQGIERFSDASCMVERTRGVLSIQRLIRHVQEKQVRRKAPVQPPPARAKPPPPQPQPTRAKGQRPQPARQWPPRSEEP